MNDEKIIERFINRIQKANESFLMEIGKSIKKLKKLKPSEARKLIQILKYGGNYEDIINQIKKYTNLNLKDIDKVFSSYAKRDMEFSKKFYDYRKLPMVKYEDNIALKRQTESLASITKNEMYDYTRKNVLGYTIKDNNNKVIFKGMKEVYNDLLEEALLNVGEGKETFDSAIRRTLKSLGQSGIRTVDYESGRHVRLDSTVRMHLKSRLTELHNENQMLFGKEFKSDGIEISVHENPAIDHEEVQGRQFSNDEYKKLQEGKNAKDYKGNIYNLDHDRKNGYRPIGELNCYHYIFAIILGISTQEYSDDELQEIINRNEEGFNFDGKHYTMYEGTQLQRQLERKIREQKDTQILARASGDDELVGESQRNITYLSQKYKELSNASGLPVKRNRMAVSSYRRVNTKRRNFKEIEYARKNNIIWHSTENLEEMVKDDNIIEPSFSVAKEFNGKVRYGSQFIEFKPEILENVKENTYLYKGDGGNKYSGYNNKFNNLMDLLKDSPKNYNELKFNEDLKFLKYIKQVHIRDDEPNKTIKLLEENNIKYDFYKDIRTRPPKKTRK